MTFLLLAFLISLHGTGLLMGSMQLPVALSLKDSLGGSSSYCTLISNTVHRGPMRSLLPYFQKFAGGIGNWWQVCSVG